jgi:hypothetical protein
MRSTRVGSRLPLGVWYGDDLYSEGYDTRLTGPF